jgi:rod shape-determining protein MreC
LAAALLLILDIMRVPLVGQIRGRLSDVTTPIVYFSQSIGQYLINIKESAGNLGGLAKENAKLRDNIIKLENWRDIATRLKKENEALSELLKLASPEFPVLTTAKVVAYPIGNFQSSLVIKAGIRDGIKRGQPVIFGHSLVGRIASAGNHTSTVMLLDDVHSKIPVIIGDLGAHGILSGTNEAKAKLTLVDREILLNGSYRIVTSGKGGIFPAGILVGYVNVSSSRNGTIYVFPKLRWQDLAYVQILEKVVPQEF